MNKNINQNNAMKICVTLGKSAQKMMEMLQKVYGDDTMKGTTLYWLFNTFSRSV